MGLYRSMSAVAPDQVWQSSHLGGHRFAATAVCLPGGFQYGRLRAADGPDLLRAHERKELYDLDKYRGCTAFSAPVQAAAVAARRQEEVTGVGALELLTVSSSGPNQTKALFALEGIGEVEMDVSATKSKRAWRFSCAKPKESNAEVFSVRKA
jgi:hypothetical protein